MQAKELFSKLLTNLKTYLQNEGIEVPQEFSSVDPDTAIIMLRMHIDPKQKGGEGAIKKALQIFEERHPTLIAKITSDQREKIERFVTAMLELV